MQDNDQGNFSVGFIVGVLAGATGFFLTKTNEGREIREKISSQWDTIKKKLEDEGVIGKDEVGLLDLIAKTREKIYHILGEEPPKTRKKRLKRGRKPKSKLKTDKKAISVKKKKMFKGI